MPRSSTRVIRSGALIDGNGGPPLSQGIIVVRDDRIEAVGRPADLEIPGDAEVIDATGKTVMPGLIEAHAHVGGGPKDQKTLRLSLQRGITTVCSVSANPPGIALREGIEEDAVRGCARLIAACVVTCTHGHVKYRTADGPWEVRKAVREMVMAGADFIKTAASGGFWGANEVCAVRNYTYEELEALTDEAHAWNVPVVVHCHTQPGLDSCIRASVDQIHHGAFIDEAAIQGIREKNLYYIPTLTVTGPRNIDEHARTRPWMVKEMQEAQEIHRKGVRRAYEIGVKIGVGTDYPGASCWEVGEKTMFELQELVACGLRPMEALVAATRTNAEAYGRLEDLGTLEPGKKADLLVVDGDPADDVSILQDESNIHMVIKDGAVESTDEAYKQYYRVREDQPPDRRRSLDIRY